MKHAFVTADVFTDRIFGGNPLAVFPDATGIDPAFMQTIADEFNLSETVFVLPPEDAANTARVRIFTPAAEVPFAGHPTLGTAHVLAATGAVPLAGDETRIVLEEGVGPVPVTIRARAGKPVFCELSAAQMPEFGPAPPPAAEIARVLSLDPGDLAIEMPPRAVSCGVPFLFVPVLDRAVLARARIDLAAWRASLGDFWAPSVYVFALDPELPDSTLRARMFAPAMGVDEDPATGSAAAALAGFLGAQPLASEGTLRWIVEQGFEMGRPSILAVEAERSGGAITAIRVGGGTVIVSTGEMDIPD